ncbi:MAG: D-alanyl-D-alanine carboxypeptidase/D-alanyl-D-alanine-endopeptidase [Flavobacteriales bacterium]
MFLRPEPEHYSRSLKGGSLILLQVLFLALPACKGTNGDPTKKKEAHGRSSSLHQAVQKLANDPVLEKGRLAFSAYAIGSGKKLSGHRSSELIVPASTQKLVTTISALRILGPKHRFRTILGYRGRIENGTLKGDLIIKGGGDPAFLSKEFPEHYGTPKNLFDRWVKALERAGIEKVEGKLLVDAGYFPPNTLSRGRIWEDMGNYFGAFPSGMNIMDNAFELRFRTPDEKGEQSRIIGRSPQTPWLKIENRVKSSELQKDEAYIFGKPYDEQRIVEGTLPAGKASYSIEGAMPDPARTTAWMLHEQLQQKEIAIENGFSTFRREGITERAISRGVDTVHSPRLKTIVKKTNVKSKNLFAETLLLEAGKSLGSKAKPGPAGEALLERIEAWGIDTEGLRMDDGSGLAPTNRITAAFLVKLLKKAWAGKHRHTIKNSLPVAGKSGTMSYIGGGTAAEGRIRAKSGYMSGVLAYAGYAKARDGEWKAFALIANGFTCSASSMRNKMEKVLVELVK